MTVPKGSGWTQRTDEEISLAIVDAHGVLSAAARSLGITRQTLQKRIQNNLELQETLNAERDTVIDVAENVLYDALLRGEIGAAMFTLKTIGKARGWGESQEINLLGKMANINLNYDFEKLSLEEKLQLEAILSKSARED